MQVYQLVFKLLKKFLNGFDLYIESKISNSRKDAVRRGKSILCII